MRPSYLLLIIFCYSIVWKGIAQTSSDLQKQLDSLKNLDANIASMIQDLQTQREHLAHQLLLLQEQNQVVYKGSTTQKEALVTGSGGIMREDPHIGSNAIGFIPSGSIVLVHDFYQSSFFRIGYDGKTGYLSESALVQSDELLSIKQHWQAPASLKNIVATEVTIAPKATKESHSYPTRKYITGPRGGCYYINSSGNKTYVDRSFCGGTNNPMKSYSGRTYYKGPRGGCYYISSGGNKVYVARGMCD